MRFFGFGSGVRFSVRVVVRVRCRVHERKRWGAVAGTFRRSWGNSQSHACNHERACGTSESHIREHAERRPEEIQVR